MLFDQGPNRFEADLPNSYDVTIRYQGPTGKEYEETQTLDLTPLFGMETIRPKTTHDIGKELEEIRKTLKRIEGHLKQ
jgi:hypothetical protein